MTKKIFAQPEMMVVRMNNNDIVTMSLQGAYDGSSDILAPDRFRDFEDYSY